jgi:peptide/nickel transport system permease protein
MRAFLRNPAGVISLAFLLLVVALALLAPRIYPDDPMEMVARPFLWPGQNPAYPLGTDSLGRDVAAGLVWGTRVSLLVGFSAMVLGVTLGLAVGAVAGYFGGRVDAALVKLIEIFQTPPSFVLLIVLVAIAQPTIARIVRSEFRSLREKDFVMAARGLGYGHARIILAEILPNALPPVIVTASVLVATAILMESALSFLGLGDPNLVSWGSMIGAGRELLRTAWYLSAIPGFAIVLTVLALNLLGDALNDALNPRVAAER